jgi:hypothetical protein
MRTIILIAAIILADAIAGSQKSGLSKAERRFLRVVFFCTVTMDIIEFIRTITH